MSEPGSTKVEAQPSVPVGSNGSVALPLDAQGLVNAPKQQHHPAHNDAPERRPGFIITPGVGFALRTTLAGMAALFVAMWMQLDTPRWAIWTVFIVSPPVRGNALRKTAARIAGTFTGCVVGVAAVGLFPQDRVGFYVLFSLWLGACAYWATLRREYVSYAASLAAFTSAIVSAGVSAQPLATWQIATDRGCATVLGILFALFASNLAATTDDVPGDLTKHICAIATDLLDWSVRQLQAGNSSEPMDAPLTAKILALDESCTNSLAERPALYTVKPWICGVPTALLSLQSAVLSMRDAISPQALATARAATDVLRGVADFLRSGAALELPALDQQTDSLRELLKSQPAQAPAMRETIHVLLYLLGSLQALLTFQPSDAATPLYPPPKFMARPCAATINTIRAIVGMGAGFIIWDLTAWPQGPVFMVIIAVVVVVLVKIDDPVIAVWAAVVGSTAGGVIALGLKYLLLVGFNDPVNLVLALFPFLFIAAWIETKGKLAPFGVVLAIGLLYVTEPSNPQVYDFAHDVNTLIAIEAGCLFTALLFLTIGTPKKGAERIAELLTRMRRFRGTTLSTWTHEQRLAWETQMYDQLRVLQETSTDATHRRHGVNLVLSGLKLSKTGPYFCEPVAN
jgi:uncharacterized membrane protein YccC